jgi:hypothetical protein
MLHIRGYGIILKITLRIIFLSFITAISTFGQETKKKKGVPTAIYRQDNIVIDGKMNDWPELISFYNKDSKLGYSIANDSSKFYFCFIMSDQLMQMKILRMGLYIGIDTMGKKNQDISICYPMPGSFRGNTKNGERPDFEKIKATFRNSPQYMSLNGFRNGNGTSPIQAVNGVAAKLDWDAEGNMIYELEIPFNAFQLRGFSNQLYALNVFLPAIKRPQVNGVSGATASGGGRPGGGGPPPGVSGGQNSGAIMFEDQKFRQRFYLNSGK